MERNWMTIVEERLRRNCDSSLTKYSLKVYRKTPHEIKRKSDLVDNSINNNLDMSFKIPIVHQYHEHSVPHIAEEDCNNLLLKRSFEYNYVPLVLVENQNSKVVTFQNDATAYWRESQGRDHGNMEVSSLQWPGIEEIMLSYNRYEKGNT